MIPPTAQRRALQHETEIQIGARRGCLAHILAVRSGGRAACGTRSKRLSPLHGPRLWATPLCRRCTAIVARWPEPSAADRIPIDLAPVHLLEEAVALAPTSDVLTSIDLEATIRGVPCWVGEGTAPWQKQLAARRRKLKQAADPQPIVRVRVKRSAELSAIEYVETRKLQRRHYGQIVRAIQSSAR